MGKNSFRSQNNTKLIEFNNQKTYTKHWFSKITFHKDFFLKTHQNIQSINHQLPQNASKIIETQSKQNQKTQKNFLVHKQQLFFLQSLFMSISFHFSVWFQVFLYTCKFRFIKISTNLAVLFQSKWWIFRAPIRSACLDECCVNLRSPYVCHISTAKEIHNRRSRVLNSSWNSRAFAFLTSLKSSSLRIGTRAAEKRDLGSQI